MDNRFEKGHQASPLTGHLTGKAPITSTTHTVRLLFVLLSTWLFTEQLLDSMYGLLYRQIRDLTANTVHSRFFSSKEVKGVRLNIPTALGWLSIKKIATHILNCQRKDAKTAAGGLQVKVPKINVLK